MSDDAWTELSRHFTEPELIELCLLIGHYEMLAMTINSLRIEPDTFGGGAHGAAHPLAGKRVLITGAARGIGAATAQRLSERGARVVVAGIEREQLEQVARDCGGIAVPCDVRHRDEVEAAVNAAVDHLGGLDIVIANAGVAAQLPIDGGDPEIFERTIDVNLLGTYYTLRAAAPHISHPGGYALAIASLAAAVHVPLLGAYSASKAGVEALGNSLRVELAGTGARVGVAYFGELETDMTRRGFGTEAAAAITRGPQYVAPLRVGVDAIERGCHPPLPARHGAGIRRAVAPRPDGGPAGHRSRLPSRARAGARDRSRRARAADDAATLGKTLLWVPLDPRSVVAWSSWGTERSERAAHADGGAWQHSSSLPQGRRPTASCSSGITTSGSPTPMGPASTR